MASDLKSFTVFQDETGDSVLCRLSIETSMCKPHPLRLKVMICCVAPGDHVQMVWCNVNTADSPSVRSYLRSHTVEVTSNSRSWGHKGTLTKDRRLFATISSHMVTLLVILSLTLLIFRSNYQPMQGSPKTNV
ncbi:hypothetical protein BC833DRAFT_568060 [Globomyces pollinis-pini]|nr:hypothetical protein BC833DRAFT_568060 [Globomyces pollinis-pini]